MITTQSTATALSVMVLYASHSNLAPIRFDPSFVVGGRLHASLLPLLDGAKGQPIHASSLHRVRDVRCCLQAKGMEKVTTGLLVAEYLTQPELD